MSDPLKRGLRDRSKRRHFDSEVRMSLRKNEEGEHFSYSKPYSRDFINPSQLLNQEAKLLVKFANTANRYYILYQQMMGARVECEEGKGGESREAKGGRKEESGKENGRKGGEGGKGMDVEGNRKGKQIYSNGKSREKSYSSKNDNFKEKALAAANSVLEIEKAISKNSKSNSLSTKPPKQTIKPKPTQDRPEPANGADKHKLKAIDGRPFKRASYHVAIAAYIYSQINKGQNALKDPTSASRKLKEEMGRQQ